MNACKYCGCTEARACLVHTQDLPEAATAMVRHNLEENVWSCWWINPERDVCSAPACVEKHFIARQYSTAIATMSPAQLPAKMEAAMRAAQAKLPDGVGVTVFVFDMGAPGGMGYISNANRGDMVRAIGEWLRRVRGQN